MEVTRRELLGTMATGSLALGAAELSKAIDVIKENVPGPEKPKYRSMGMGPLADPANVFVRQFRYTISGEHLAEWYNFSVEVDWMDKNLTLTSYEVITPEGIPIWNWADAVQQNKYKNETLLLTTFDGCGNELYRKRMHGISITNRINKFDYSSSEASLHEVHIHFNKWTDEPIQSIQHPVVEKGEAKIDHLNARHFIK